jgi:hypothetical protein
VGVWSTPRPGCFTFGKDPVHIVHEAGWTPRNITQRSDVAKATALYCNTLMSHFQPLHILVTSDSRTPCRILSVTHIGGRFVKRGLLFKLSYLSKFHGGLPYYDTARSGRCIVMSGEYTSSIFKLRSSTLVAKSSTLFFRHALVYFKALLHTY